MNTTAQTDIQNAINAISTLQGLYRNAMERGYGINDSQHELQVLGAALHAAQVAGEQIPEVAAFLLEQSLRRSLQEFAAEQDAAIIERDELIAIQQRHYDEDGHRQVRHQPDPCDFRPLSFWVDAPDSERIPAVC